MTLKHILFLFFIFCFTTSFSQMILNRDTSLTISENGIAFSSAFSGGINAGQFSEIDLNLDGIMDLVVFDKSGNKISPFINDNGNYIYTPKYRSAFPKAHDWMLLADYNCDGKNDIYTYSSGGMAIYENTSSTNLSFSLVTSLVFSDYGSNNLNIYISPIDIPAIADIDYDGDLDILAYSNSGGFIKYHKNMAIELTGSCDTVAFEFSEDCWGLFYEDLDGYVLNCQNCVCTPIVNPNNPNSKQKHAGSTLLAIDIDNDNDMDLVLGNVGNDNLNLLINGGDNQNALMISTDSIFPQNNSNTMAADMNFFPASYYLDVTNDGIKDLIVTTNSQSNSENFESCWLYENAGQTNNPDFNFVQTNFLQSDMIDLGKSAFPTFYDYNNDSLLDLVVGNYGYHVAYNDPISSLALFENTGTKDIPKYDLIDRDWQGISTVDLNTTLTLPALNISPTFGDLDGDGDKDMILGDANGELHYFTNQAGNFNITAPNYLSIVGSFSQPQLVDVDRDGLLDIIIGEQDGSINYCPNSGTATIAAFNTIIENWGGIDVDTNYISYGYSSPKLIDSSGVYQLFVGSYTGTIYQFTNIDGNLNGQFSPVYSTTANLWDGGKCSFTLADINNDNHPEMILGNVSGGIAYFSSDTLLNDTSIISTNILNNNQEKFSIYPNPAVNKLTIESSEIGIIKIKNLLGKTIYTLRKNNYLLEINTSHFANGIYILQLNTMSSKILIQ